MLHLFEAPTFTDAVAGPATAGAAVKDKVAMQLETILKGFIEAVQRSGSNTQALAKMCDDVTERPQAERHFKWWTDKCIQHAVHPFISVSYGPIA